MATEERNIVAEWESTLQAAKSRTCNAETKVRVRSGPTSRRFLKSGAETKG